MPTAREGSDGSDPTASPASRGSVGERRESASDPASDPAFHFVALGDDPLGKAALGRAGQRWLEAASLEAAREFVAEVRAAGSDPDAWFAIHGADEHATNPIRRLAPHAAIRDPPSDRASACAAAATHEPTVTSFLNRAARRAIEETDAASSSSRERADLASDPAWIVLRRITARRRRAAKRRRTKHAVAGGKIAEGGGREGGGREGGGREEGGGRKEGGGRGSRRERPLDDDEGWRSASKSSLRDAVSRFADVASALLMSERETEAASAAALLLRGAESDDAIVSEGTSLGRSGAVMEGLRLTSLTPGAGKSGRLLNLRVDDDAEGLPPSAVNVGDRVAVAIIPDDDDDSPELVGTDASTDEETATRAFEAECEVRALNPRGGEVTLAETEGTPEELDAVFERVVGRRLRLVRVPDAVTYERQLAALRTLRNVPTSRTNPPAMLAVKALFAATRCPIEKDEEVNLRAAAARSASEDASTNEEEDASAFSETAFNRVAGYFADSPDVRSPRAPRRVSADDLPPLNLDPPSRGGGGPLPRGFDDAQALAVRAALTSWAPVTWVQGPPGTGKTGVVVEIIRRAVASGQRVLACAPSNAAVDNLVERLAGLDDDVDFVRIGAPERISSAALSRSLDARVREETSGVFNASRNLRRRELLDATRKGWERQDELRRRGVRRNPKASEGDDVDSLRDALATLRREQRGLAKSGKKARAAAERSVLSNADVVLATTIGAGAENVQRLPAFDLVVLDEAAQATEPAAWIPLVRCTRAVLVGDPCQLAPLVRSPDAAAGGLTTPLMARLALPQQAADAANDGSHGCAPVALLTAGVLGCVLSTQYRSHASISEWASREMYRGALAAADAVASRTLRDLPGVTTTCATSTPLLLLDTRTEGGMLLSGCGEISESELRRKDADATTRGGDEEDASISLSSLVNEGEAYAVTMHVVGLLNSGIVPRDIAVQSPYAAQVRLIQRRLADAAAQGLARGVELVEVASVDSFQGREAEAVVVSTVRSNERRAVGFLSDARRANVAVTRARRHVAVVGDSVTVGSDPFLGRLLAHIRAHGVTTPANEYKEIHEVIER